MLSSMKVNPVTCSARAIDFLLERLSGCVLHISSCASFQETTTFEVSVFYVKCAIGRLACLLYIFLHKFQYFLTLFLTAVHESMTLKADFFDTIVPVVLPSLNKSLSRCLAAPYTPFTMESMALLEG